MSAFRITGICLIILLSNRVTGQGGRFKRLQAKEEAKYKESFPPVLENPYPDESIGSHLQKLYYQQASESCNIRRSNLRDYIPHELKSGYGEDRLRETLVYEMPISATNLLFMTFTAADLLQLEDGTYSESQYIEANRIVGINNNLVNYGQSLINSASGFPSLVFQKSCGSYFDGSFDAEVNAPVAELKTSLSVETKKSSSITTISGKFVSPLYLIFKRNNIQSTFAHLLLWNIYHESFIQDSILTLYEEGKYISEFDGTILTRSNGREKSIQLSTRLSAGISAGMFASNGQINAGIDNKMSFSLKDFSSLIHRGSSGNLSFSTRNLPKVNDINQKLQNSISFGEQPSFDGYITHLLPTVLTRNLYGVPEELCNQNSWIIHSTDDYSVEVWDEKPSVSSVSRINGKDGFPQCTCTIRGNIKKQAISDAEHGNLDLQLTLKNTKQIGDNQLQVIVTEPSVKITDAPKIINLNDNIISATKSEVNNAITGTYYTYDISFNIDDTGIDLTEPYEVKNISVKYINSSRADSLKSDNITYNPGDLSVSDEPTILGNSIKLRIETKDYPPEFTNVSDVNATFKIEFEIQLENETYTKLATKNINLKIPVHTLDIQVGVAALDDLSSGEGENLKN